MKFKHILPIAIPASVMAITLPMITSCAEQTHETKFNLNVDNFKPGTKVLSMSKADWDAKSPEDKTNIYFQNIHSDYRIFAGDVAYSVYVAGEGEFDKNEVSVKLIKEPDVLNNKLYFSFKHDAKVKNAEQGIINLTYKNVPMHVVKENGKDLVVPTWPTNGTDTEKKNWIINNDVSITGTMSKIETSGIKEIIEYSLNKDNVVTGPSGNLDSWHGALDVPYIRLETYFLSSVNA